MAAHAELNAWLLPATARDEWLRLSKELDSGPSVPCRDGDSNAWWPQAKETGSPVTRGAIDACRGRRAQAAGLDYALAAEERFGIWDGMPPGPEGLSLGRQLTGPRAYYRRDATLAWY